MEGIERPCSRGTQAHVDDGVSLFAGADGVGAAAGALEPLSPALVLAGVLLAVPSLPAAAASLLLLAAGLFEVDE